MNKSEKREVASLAKYFQAGLVDRATAARMLSALIRSAMTKQSKTELMDRAHMFGVLGHPEFIV